MNDITLVIPAKNEAESLPQVLDELKRFDIKKLGVLINKIIIEDDEFNVLLEKIFFDFKNKKRSWCKWWLSAFETFFFLIILLKRENKFSKAGYHNKRQIKYGETSSFINVNSITKYAM